jgi:hypothetical protein
MCGPGFFIVVSPNHPVATQDERFDAPLVRCPKNVGDFIDNLIGVRKSFCLEAGFVRGAHQFGFRASTSLFSELIYGKLVRVALNFSLRDAHFRESTKFRRQLGYALQRPTVSPLSEDGWVAVNTIIEERTVRELMPRLKAAHAQGIVEYPLNKIVL